MTDAAIARAVESRDANRLDTRERAEERAEAIDTRAWSIAQRIVATPGALGRYMTEHDMLMHELMVPRADRLGDETMEDALLGLLTLGLTAREPAMVAWRVREIAGAMVDVLEQRQDIRAKAEHELEDSE